MCEPELICFELLTGAKGGSKGLSYQRAKSREEEERVVRQQSNIKNGARLFITHI